MDAFEEKWEKKLLSGDDEYWLNLPPRPPRQFPQQNPKLPTLSAHTVGSYGKPLPSGDLYSADLIVFVMRLLHSRSENHSKVSNTLPNSMVETVTTPTNPPNQQNIGSWWDVYLDFIAMDPRKPLQIQPLNSTTYLEDGKPHLGCHWFVKGVNRLALITPSRSLGDF